MTEHKSEDESNCGCSACTSCEKRIIAVSFVILISIIAIFIFIDSKKQQNIDVVQAISTMENKTIILKRADLKEFPIKVEVAKTSKQQEYGLMNRKHLSENTGMFFPYDMPQNVQFWMKDTLIPLDIIFVSPNGEINKIVYGAKPNDKTKIFSEKPVIAVLELPAGNVKRMGIKIGDVLRK